MLVRAPSNVYHLLWLSDTAKRTENSRKGDPAECTELGSWKDSGAVKTDTGRAHFSPEGIWLIACFLHTRNVVSLRTPLSLKQHWGRGFSFSCAEGFQRQNAKDNCFVRYIF